MPPLAAPATAQAPSSPREAEAISDISTRVPTEFEKESLVASLTSQVTHKKSPGGRLKNDPFICQKSQTLSRHGNFNSASKPAAIPFD
jgi:hypothetical protein